MTRRPRFVAAASALAVSIASAHAARAQPTSADKAVAEGLFQQGKKMMDSGDTSGACAKFAESERMVPKLGTLLNLATCHEKEGKTASAWAEFTEAATQATRANQKDRAKYAREHAQALEQQLGHVIVDVKAPAEGIVVTMDGRPVGDAAWGTPIPIDPGEHKLEATAPGRKPWTGSVQIGSGGARQTVEVPPLDQVPVAAEPAAPAPAAADASAQQADRHGSDGSTQRAVGFALIGVGVVGIGVGAYFGVRTFSKESESGGHCTDTVCDPDGVDLRADARRSATISTIAIAAGAAVAVTGVVVALVAPRRTSPRAATLAPVAGPGAAGLRVVGRW